MNKKILVLGMVGIGAENGAWPHHSNDDHAIQTREAHRKTRADFTPRWSVPAALRESRWYRWEGRVTLREGAGCRSLRP